jgi:hypothetical protein
MSSLISIGKFSLAVAMGSPNARVIACRVVRPRCIYYETGLQGRRLMHWSISERGTKGQSQQKEGEEERGQMILLAFSSASLKKQSNFIECV